MKKQKKIHFKPGLTFGWELEASRRANAHIPGLEADHDGSVSGDQMEYRVKRQYVYDPDASLAILRRLVLSQALAVDNSCGFHVHIGLKRKSRLLHAWASWFVQLARDVEKEAFDAVPRSRTRNNYCRSWQNNPESIVALTYTRNKHSSPNRYNWVNPTEIFRPGGIRTVEIRLMGDCKSYTYLLAWASACRLMGLSAWALINDPSRLEMERQNLKGMFNLIQYTFREPATTKERVGNALALAVKAGFYQPFGRPLEKLRTREELIRSQSRVTEEDQSLFDTRVGELRRYVGRSRPNRTITAGSLVRVLEGSQMARQGEYYPVVEVTPIHVRLFIPEEGVNWWVPRSCVAPVEVTQGGVAISAG